MRILFKRLLPGMIFVLWFALPVSAQDSAQLLLPDLFLPAVAQARSEQNPSPEVIRWRNVEIDFSVLDETARGLPYRQEASQPSFVFNLFEDVRYDAMVEDVQAMANGSVGMTGKIDSLVLSEFILVARGEIMQAYVQVGERYFEIRFDGASHVISEVDPNLYPEPLEPQVLDPEGLIAPAPGALPDVSQPQADPAGQIDVLAVYTPAARAAVGGTASMEAKIQASILSANQGYTASDVSQQVRLVGMEEVDYTETVPGVTDVYTTWLYGLYRLTFGHYGSDPVNANYLADARAYRETYGADLVFMVTALPYGYCGLGWLAGHTYQANIGYSVVRYNCTGTTAYSVQHEMGHNMGACHDRDNNSSNGCYDMAYSYGYQQPNQFYTVMSYSTGCGSCSRINRWSNPNLSYNGFPTGVPLGNPEAAFNTLTLNNTRANVANYRQSVHPISASFVSPTPDGTLMIPRTILDVSASSIFGDIVRVTYSAYYDGSWHILHTDTNGSDGWAYLWSTYNLSEQVIQVKAEIEDSSVNTEVIQQQNIQLSRSHTIGGIYTSRQSDNVSEDQESTGEIVQGQLDAAAQNLVLPEPQESSGRRRYFTPFKRWLLY